MFFVSSFFSYFPVPIINNVETALAAPGTRVRTVEFFAGQDAGSATNDNVGTANNFPQQNVQIAESSVDIISAYVEFTAQIGSTTAATITEGLIYFDACAPTACTPTPAIIYHSAGLGTNSAEGQTIRLRANVASEATLASFTGGTFAFQVGYCFDGASGSDNGACNGTSAANIQSANAKLVVSYTYDDTSATQTNTVIYPLESNTTGPVGSKTAVQASCTMDSNCPTLSYNANIPEISSQVSQFFHTQFSAGAGAAGTTTDHAFIPQVNGNASGSTIYFEQALTSNGGWMNHLVSGLSGYANNSSQALEMGVNGNTWVMGGENYVTYTYAESAATKTKTIVLPVGEVQTVGSTTKSGLVGPTVYFPEAGVNVEKAWFRVHTSAGGNATAVNLVLTTKVGSNAESGNSSYAFAGGTGTLQGISDDGYFIHMVPSADYTHLETATADTGVPVQMTADWATARGAVSAELVITYTYTGEDDGFINTQRLWAGQTTAAGATTFSAPDGTVDPYINAGDGSATILGVSLDVAGKDTSSTASQTVGGLMTVSPNACSASNTSTTLTDSEITKIRLFKAITGVVTTSNSDTYTPCYSSSQATIFNGSVAITTMYDFRTITISGTANGNDGATVKAAVNGTVKAQTDTISGGAWSIDLVPRPAPDDIVTVWVDNVSDANESTAVTKYSSGDVTGMVLNTGVLTIGSDQNTSVSTTNMGLCDADTGCADEDIMHTSDSGVLSVQGTGNSYTGETLSVLSGDTLTVASASTESITTELLNNAGTITATGTPTITLAGTTGTLFTNSGTFTAASSTVNLTGNGNATVNSGSPTFYNLTSSGTGTKTLGAGITIDTNGTLSVTAGTFDPSTYLVTGSGTNTLSVGASGTINVGASTFAGSYSAGFGTVTLNATSTVNYNLGGTQTVSSTPTYGHLTISGSGTKTLGGNTTAAGTVTVTAGTLDTDVTNNRSLTALDIVINGGTLTARDSVITLTDTSGTLFTISSGTFTAGTSEVIISGNGSATIASGTPSFYDLTITGTGTKSLGEALTVTNLLKISAGTLDTDTTNDYTINAGQINFAGGTSNFVIGTETVGATDFTSVKWWSSKYTSSAAGSITSMSFYGNSTGTANYKLAIWEDNAGSPGALLAQSSSASINTTPGWWTENISYSVSASEVLHLGFVSDDWVQLYRDAGSTNQYTEFTEEYTNWPTTPNPPTVGSQADFNISIHADVTGSGGGTLKLNDSTVNLTGTGTVFDADGGTIDVSTGTSTIKLTDTSSSAKTFAGAGKTYDNFWIAPSTGTGQINITGSNTFLDFKDDGTGAHTIQFAVDSTTTISTLTLDTDAGADITLQSANTGTGDWNIVDSTGTNTVSNIVIKDSNASGGATWDADDGTNTDGGNNSGWDFPSGVCTASITGSWNTGGNWSNCGGVGGVPATDEDVEIGSGVTITLDVATPVLNSLTIDGTLDTSGSDYAVNTEIIDISSTGTLTANDSTITISGITGTLFTKHATGTFTAGGSTVVFSGNGSATLVSGTPTFYNLTSSGTGTKSLGANLTVSNNLTISNSAGALDTSSGGNYTINAGHIIMPAGATDVFGDNVTGNDFTQLDNVLLTVRFTMPENGSATDINIHLGASTGTVSMAGGIYEYNSVSGDLDLVAYSGNVSQGTTAGWVSIPIVAELESGKVYHLAMWADGDYVMQYDSGSSQQTQSQESGLTFGTWPSTILDSNLTKYDVTCSIYLDYLPGGVLTANASTINLTGTSGTLFDNEAGVFNEDTSTVDMTGNGNATINTEPTTFYNLTSSGTGVKTLGEDISITSNRTLSVTAGTFDPSTYTVTGNGTNTLSVGANGTIRVGASTFDGSYTTGFNTKTFNATSVVDYALAGTQTIDSTLSYGWLTVSGSGTKTLGGNLSIPGTITVSGGTLDTDSGNNRSISADKIVISGGTLSANDSTITLTGTSGTLLSEPSGTFTAGTSEVILSGNGSATIASGTPSFYDLTSNGTGTKSLGEALTVTNLFKISNGTVDTTGSDYTINAGRLEVASGADGTFGEDSILPNDNTTTSIITTRFTSTGSGIANKITTYVQSPSGTVNMRAALYSAGTINGDPAPIDLLSSAPNSVSLDTTAQWLEIPIDDYTIEDATDYYIAVWGDNTFRLWYEPNVSYTERSFESSDGTFPNWIDPFTSSNAYFLYDTVGNYYVTYEGTGGTLTANDSTINISGTSGTLFTKGAAATFDAGGSTVNLTGNGDATVVSGDPVFYNLTSSGTGTKSLGEALTATGALTISAGTLDTTSANNYTVNAGSLIINGGTFTPQASTINLTGVGTVFNYTSGTFTAGTSTVKLTDTNSSSKTFAGGGQTFSTLWITGNGTGEYIISGSNTFGEFKVDTPPHTIKFTAGTTQTVTTWDVSGTNGNMITLASTSNGTKWNLSKSSGTVNSDFLNIRDSAAAGGATWNAGSHSIDNTNGGSTNTGWVFTYVPRGGGAVQNIESSATPDPEVGGGDSDGGDGDTESGNGGVETGGGSGGGGGSGDDLGYLMINTGSMLAQLFEASKFLTTKIFNWF